MIQRALAVGSRSTSSVQFVDAGRDVPDTIQEWTRVDNLETTIVLENRASHAASYRSRDKLVSINRESGEDRYDSMEPSFLESFNAIPNCQFALTQSLARTSLANEIWRLFAYGIVIVLLAEAWLTMPKRKLVKLTQVPRMVEFASFQGAPR
jgi:hypothetical protein